MSRIVKADELLPILNPGSGNKNSWIQEFERRLRSFCGSQSIRIVGAALACPCWTYTTGSRWLLKLLFKFDGHVGPNMSSAINSWIPRQACTATRLVSWYLC